MTQAVPPGIRHGARGSGHLQAMNPEQHEQQRRLWLSRHSRRMCCDRGCCSRRMCCDRCYPSTPGGCAAIGAVPPGGCAAIGAVIPGTPGGCATMGAVPPGGCAAIAVTCRGSGAGAVRGRARPRPAPRGRPAAVGGWEASAAGKQQLRLLIRFGGGVGGVCGKSQAMDLPFF